jgi:hypothetical protein
MEGRYVLIIGWFGLGDFGLTFGVRVHENEKLLVVSLWAFSNIIQFSCKNLANQISQNSRLNWIILENARSV